jgi:hypothetical protein
MLKIEIFGTKAQDGLPIATREGRVYTLDQFHIRLIAHRPSPIRSMNRDFSFAYAIPSRL